MSHIAPVRLALGALALSLPAQLSAAGFVKDGDGWARLTPEARAAYVQGLSDTANFIYLNDDLPTAIVKLARTRCLVEQKTTTAILADRITMAYGRTPELRKQPPAVIYVMRMAESCRDYINQERARFNLPPQ